MDQSQPARSEPDCGDGDGEQKQAQGLGQNRGDDQLVHVKTDSNCTEESAVSYMFFCVIITVKQVLQVHS